MWLGPLWLYQLRTYFTNDETYHPMTIAHSRYACLNRGLVGGRSRLPGLNRQWVEQATLVECLVDDTAYTTLVNPSFLLKTTTPVG